jgi:hypothetical protein
VLLLRRLLAANVTHAIQPDQDPHTVISLLRTYSSLDTEITVDGATTLALPSRIVYPRIPYFTDPQPIWHGDGSDELIQRTRSEIGLPHSLMKSLLPSTGIMYLRDWLDLHESEVPYVLERVVIADYKAAMQASSGDELPYWSAPFKDLEVSKNWWEPLRSGLSHVMRIAENSDEVITYISRQNVESGPTLKAEDNDVLVMELEKLARDTKCIVEIVPYSAPWEEKLSAILKSTVRTLPPFFGIAHTSCAHSSVGCTRSLWRAPI